MAGGESEARDVRTSRSSKAPPLYMGDVARIELGFCRVAQRDVGIAGGKRKKIWEDFLEAQRLGEVFGFTWYVCHSMLGGYSNGD